MEDGAVSVTFSRAVGVRCGVIWGQHLWVPRNGDLGGGGGAQWGLWGTLGSVGTQWGLSGAAMDPL